jgi:hypothetical protein
MIDKELFEKMFVSVFKPKSDEKIVLFYDVPTESIEDSSKWKERRELVDEWLRLCSGFSDIYGFSVEKMFFDSTGVIDGQIDDGVLELIKNYNIIIAMTEFSITSSLVLLVKKFQKSMRCASMPLVEKRMMNSVLMMDYSEVKRYAHTIKNYLDEANSAKINFSTGDSLFLDLRHRHANADDGDCGYPGACINLPSGEGFIAPYEANDVEKLRFGVSKTAGILPFYFYDEFVKCVVKNNRINEIICKNKVKKELSDFFDGFSNRRNIAELGIGCNPNAQVTGNFIEDEKAGIHIAYGMSRHLGGKINSDIHNDIVYAKNCPVYAKSVVLFYEDKSLEIVKNGDLLYKALL